MQPGSDILTWGLLFLAISSLFLGYWLGLARNPARKSRQGEPHHKIFNSIADPVFVKDRKHRWVLLNDAACKFIGHPREHLLGKSDYEFFPKEEADIFWQKDEEVFASGLVNLNEESFTDSAGKKHIIVTRKSLYSDERQNLFIVGTIRDVSERRQAEEELRLARNQLEIRVAERTAELSRINEELKRSEKKHRDLAERLQESEARLRTIIDHAMDAVVVIDSHGRISYWNPQAERCFGWSSLEAMGRDAAELILPPEQRGAYDSLMQRFLTTGFEGMLNRRIETSARHSDGHVFPVEISVSPLKLGGERVFSAFVRDITETRQAEEAIRQKTEELARSNKELQDFAYVASHDLQEPLHKVIAFGDRLRASSAGSLSEKAADSLERIQRAAIRMRQLVDDLLLYARVTTRAAPYEEVELAAVIREVLSVLEWRIAESKARIQLEELPVIVADRSQMLQLFQNLISNALKFAKPGTSPEVKIWSELGQESHVEVLVEDRGIGFEEEFAGLIFKPFQRLHGRNEYEGTGMGLAICQKIVARHGGSIEVSSRLGESTLFRVKLPVHSPRAQAA